MESDGTDYAARLSATRPWRTAMSASSSLAKIANESRSPVNSRI